MPRRVTPRAAKSSAPLPPSPPPPDRTSLPLVFGFALAAGAVQAWLCHGLTQLPSAIFGGDWGYQEGCIRAILATGDPMASCSSGHAMPGYMPLYGALVALLARGTGLEVVRAMFAFSILTHVLSTLIAYSVIARHFGRRTGVVLACLWRLTFVGFAVKYTEFTGQVLVPLYFDALLLALRDAKTRHALYLGLVLAALGYAHAVAFTGGIAIAVLATPWAAWARRSERGFGAALASGLLALAIVAACSLLALGYWWRPILEFHGHTSPHYAEWNGSEIIATWQDRLEFARKILRHALWFDPSPRWAKGSEPGSFLLHLLAIVGALTLVAASARRRFPRVALIGLVTFAWCFHFLVTVPLLHTSFVPEYVRYLLWPFAALLLAAAAIVLLLERVPTGAWTVVGAVVALLAAGGVALEARAVAKDPSVTLAREKQYVPAPYASMQQWVYAHTPADAVVLSCNELSFGWSALTGRKALVSRRAQNDPFLDLDVRNKDAAIILYGHDDVMRTERLKRWKIDYLLWSADWDGLEYSRDAAGNLGMADPLFYFANAAYDAELQRAGVAFVAVHGWVDPYLRGPEFPKFDLTVVRRENYESPEHPWNHTLDPWLEPVWSYREGGRVIAALYRVRRAS
jgi:hypothetical protein